MAAAIGKVVLPPKLEAEMSIETLLQLVEDALCGAVRCAGKTVTPVLARIDWGSLPLKSWKGCFLGSVAELDKGFQSSIVASKHYLELLQRDKEVPKGDLDKVAKLKIDAMTALDEAATRCWDLYNDIQSYEEHRLLYPDHLELAPGVQKLRTIQKLVQDHLTQLKKNAAGPPPEGGARAGAGGT